jgi:hypothetical protein
VLRELIAKGMTFQAIGDHLDETRSAVRGRANRLGLKGKAKHRVVKPRPAVRAPLERVGHSNGGKHWTAEEDATLTSLYAAGQPMWKIGQALHVAATTASMRARVLGLIEPVDHSLPLRDARFTCGHCGTRSDASLDFGCGHCLPLRRVAA